MLLMRARETVMQQFRPVLAEHDLTEQQWRVLRALTANPNGLEIGELAETTCLLGPSLSRILTNLDGRQLIERSPVEHDLRRTRVAITPKAMRLVALIAPESESRYRTIEASLGDVRLADLYKLLDELAAIEPEL